MKKQPDLFASPAIPEETSIGPAPVSATLAALARRLPATVRLGTSSWYFPGWHGIVFDRKASEAVVRREGLRAYAQHPLLRTVGVDRTFYAPLPASEYARYASQVGEEFRFLIKAPSMLLTLTLAPRTKEPNPHFLDPDFALTRFVQPAQDGLGAKLGVLLFQFSPMGKSVTSAPAQFAEQLHAFLLRLPRGPIYAVELRDAALLTSHYAAALKAAGVRHCIGVHPRTPDLAAQAALASHIGPGPLIARWNLHSGMRYEEAKDRYAPFDRLLDEDPATRATLAELCAQAAMRGEDAYVIINNKAEGSAPLSAFKLAEAIVART